MSNDSGLATTTAKEAPANPTSSKTWKHIGMDLICDLSESEDGYKHILVTVCYLSSAPSQIEDIRRSNQES